MLSPRQPETNHTGVADHPLVVAIPAVNYGVDGRGRPSLPLADGTLRGISERGGDRLPAWTAADIRRPADVAAAFAALTISAVLCFNVSCQVHEVGHALVGTALGWKVERIHLCLPTGGSVVYASTSGGAWADTMESFAGGLVAAAFLVGLYGLVFWRPRTPLRGPPWWAAGFGPLL